MSQWIIGGILITLGIIKLSETIDTHPRIGIPLAIVLVVAWLIQVIKLTSRSRR